MIAMVYSRMCPTISMRILCERYMSKKWDTFSLRSGHNHVLRSLVLAQLRGGESGRPVDPGAGGLVLDEEEVVHG